MSVTFEFVSQRMASSPNNLSFFRQNHRNRKTLITSCITNCCLFLYFISSYVSGGGTSYTEAVSVWDDLVVPWGSSELVGIS